MTTENAGSQLRVKQPKAHQSKVHDIRLHLTIAEHDLNTKLNQVEKFLAKRDQVRISVQLRGRERGRPDSGYELVNKITERLAEVGSPSNQAKLNPQSGVISLTFNPKKR